ncbi:transporter protein cg10 [Theileria orientalis strain Shintoku]|uniref:Transporter protein cg10 n=1 Tax=Theileria orientalis strain Shintoku TaxID=869250 RepID=J4D734_THEOR|nr:transporter protein cg10 [Theileria orientalis strain Shintoku]PVC53067.1 transporter protein cg10 [Theileria orientalis]BAM39935.1 transporter protein cg10 [Theileria orientalis strain Shintoku]|eukprot:XP_009690236.1 transporter protein cg10 [Theileria orientalis strain Shintoku]
MSKRSSSISSNSSGSLGYLSSESEPPGTINTVGDFFVWTYGIVLRMLKWLWSKAFAISCIIFVLMDVMTTVFYKRFIDHTRNYIMFSIQLIISTFWFLISIIAVFCLLFKRKYMKRPFDTKPLVFLGFLDMLSTGISAFGSAHTSGLMLVLLGQISVPLTMVSCKLFLSKKYHHFQYISALIILFFAILKPMVNRTDTSDNRFYNNVLYLIASIPDAISSALREKQYTSKFFHVIKYQFFAFMFHFFYNILYTLVTLLPSKGFYSYFESLYDLYVNGFKCVFKGVNTIVEKCGPTIHPTCDNCKDAFKIYCMYIVFSSVIRIAYVFIMLDGSVTFTLLLGTVKVPLTSIAFSLHFIAGDSTTSLNFLDIVCFLGIVCGLLLYALGSKRSQDEHQLLDQPLLEDHEDFSIMAADRLNHPEPTSRDVFT